MCDRFRLPDDSRGPRDELGIVKSEPVPEKSGEVFNRDRNNPPTHNFSLNSRGSLVQPSSGETIVFADGTRSAQQCSPVVTHQAMAAQARAAAAPDSTPPQADKRTLRKRSYKGYKDSPPEATPKAKCGFALFRPCFLTMFPQTACCIQYLPTPTDRPIST